jgi:hypothetical protein
MLRHPHGNRHAADEACKDNNTLMENNVQNEDIATITKSPSQAKCASHMQTQSTATEIMPNDIRNFFSPKKASQSESGSPMQRNWTRNRRILESDSEQDTADTQHPVQPAVAASAMQANNDAASEVSSQNNGAAAALAQQTDETETRAVADQLILTAATVGTSNSNTDKSLTQVLPHSYNVRTAVTVKNRDTITIVSSDDDDGICARPCIAAECPSVPQQPALNTSPRRAWQIAERPRQRPEVPDKTRSQRSRYEDETQRSRYEDEAVDSSSHCCHCGGICPTTNTTTSTTSTTSISNGSGSSDNFIATDCDESDDDAVEMYRSAMAGMRNAQSARRQLRAHTTTCPVCAKFAAFLQHFM